MNSFSEWWRDWDERMKHVPESTRIQLRPFMYAAFQAGKESVKTPRVKIEKERFEFDHA